MITITDIENKVLAWNINFGWSLRKIARILKTTPNWVWLMWVNGKYKLEVQRAKQIDCKYMYYGNMDKYAGKYKTHPKIKGSTHKTHRCLWEFLWPGMLSTAACMTKIGSENHSYGWQCPYRDASYSNPWIQRTLRGDGMFSKALLPAERKKIKALLEVRDE